MKSTLDMFSYYEGLTALIASCDQILNYSTIRWVLLKVKTSGQNGMDKEIFFINRLKVLILTEYLELARFGFLFVDKIWLK